MQRVPVGKRPQPPIGTARVALNGLTQTHAWTNVVYLRLTHVNPVTVNDLETILNVMADQWGTAVAPVIANLTSLLNIQASFITGVGTSLDYTHTETKTGTAANNTTDVAACYVINWQIGDFYRGGHPRSYWPGIPSNVISNGSTINGPSGAAAAAAATNWMNAINAATSTNITQTELGTVRYASGNAWLSPPVFKPYTSASCRTLIGTQRRRISA